ncbi:hypothetical protein TNIN_167641 [Trichonephila inaurata madagascariensis]|uniref:Uncharacterized protein n=1 Tax=Trichonephila inaurata madagascariensis TaxID=2747483 RepID=A0A8X6K4X3_9ARAC|nr:hypothetical protein TNIN_167641 [Trichonephila inaurata madagascariensis]
MSHTLFEDFESLFSSVHRPWLEERSNYVYEGPGEERASEGPAEQQHQSERNANGKGTNPPKAAKDEPAQRVEGKEHCGCVLGQMYRNRTSPGKTKQIEVIKCAPIF